MGGHPGVGRQKTPGIYPMLAQCSASVVDGRSTFSQHGANSSCVLVTESLEITATLDLVLRSQSDEHCEKKSKIPLLLFNLRFNLTKLI